MTNFAVWFGLLALDLVWIYFAFRHDIPELIQDIAGLRKRR
jgi:hypothetical protein